MKSILRYAQSKEARRVEDLSFRLYVADALYAALHREVTLTKRYADILHPPKTEEPEAIISRIRAAIGGDEA